jgi:heat shock protein HslJ
MAESSPAGREFRVTAIMEDGKDVPLVEGTDPTLSFTADRFHAETGCNRLLAHYEIDNQGRLVAAEIRQTLIGCDRDRLLQEDRIRRALAGHPIMELEGSSLTLTSSSLVLFATAVG